MEDVFLYKTNVNWKMGRIGELNEGQMTPITVATPPEFPKGVPNTWSPEHLFVASVNVCLMTTFLAIAENSKLEFSSYTADAVGKLEKVDGMFLISEITLKPIITIINQKDIEKAYKIIDKSENYCLISNSIKSKIILEPEVIWVEKASKE
ncbi:MAG: OsmC family protein [bacterium]